MAAKRVGSVTLGLTLVVFGVLFLLSAFIRSLKSRKFLCQFLCHLLIVIGKAAQCCRFQRQDRFFRCEPHHRFFQRCHQGHRR